MSPINGFTDDREGAIPLPQQFFRKLLPEIDNLEELKLTLYIFWRLEHMEGEVRYLRKEDFLADKRFMEALTRGDQDADQVLENALESAVKRGTLLEARTSTAEETLYFLNTSKGRAAINAIKQGEWQYSGDPQHPVSLDMERPNIFRLYESNIGPLTPMIAETLNEAENTYPLSWIEQAVRIAVENNKRSWAYIDAILRRWQEGGRDEREDRRDTEKARRRYKEWENLSG